MLQSGEICESPFNSYWIALFVLHQMRIHHDNYLFTTDFLCIYQVVHYDSPGH